MSKTSVGLLLGFSAVALGLSPESATGGIAGILAAVATGTATNVINAQFEPSLNIVRKQLRNGSPKLPRNHDFARAIRTAHLNALEFVVETYRRTAPKNCWQTLTPAHAEARRVLLAWIKAQHRACDRDDFTLIAGLDAPENEIRSLLSNGAIAELAWDEVADALKDGGVAIPSDELRAAFEGSAEHKGWAEAALAYLTKNIRNDTVLQAVLFEAHFVSLGIKMDDLATKLDGMIGDLLTSVQSEFGEIKLLLQAAQDTLSLNPLDATDAQFTSFLAYSFHERRTRFIGREKELADLWGFLESDKRVAWWQLAGAGGQGKSRLALHLCDLLHDEWHAGFLKSDDLAKINWAKVVLKRPTLCVIDYIAAPIKGDTFVRALRHLTKRTKELPHPVRFLVLERSAFSFEPSRDLAAAWFQRLINKTDDAVLLADCCHKGEQTVLAARTLDALSDDAMVAIANAWRTDKPDPLPSLTADQCDRLLRALKGREQERRRDRAWRPLFAMLFADRLDTVDSTDQPNEAFMAILNEVLIDERTHHWQDIDGDPQPPSVNLALLATLVGTLPVETDRLRDTGFYGDPLRHKHLLAQAWTVLGRNVVDPAVLNPAGADTLPLQGRTPDLLGEYQIIKELSLTASTPDIQRATRLIADAWMIDGQATLETLTRLREDFAQHPVVDTMADYAPEDAHLPIGANGFAYYGISGFLRLALAKDADPTEPVGNGAFPLLFAAQNGHAACVEALLAHPDIRPNQINGKSGTFPLLMAAQEGHAACVEALLAHPAIQPNQIDPVDKTFPLLMPAQNGHAACVEALLAHPAIQPNQFDDKTGNFPLLMAAAAGHAACVEALLAHPDTKPNQINGKSGTFPLLMAAGAGNLDCVKLLLAGGAKINRRLVAENSSSQGTTSLRMARAMEQNDVVSYLLSQGATE